MGKDFLQNSWVRNASLQKPDAGQHGVALATAAAFFGLECEIHMGEVDIAKQALQCHQDEDSGGKGSAGYPWP